MPAHIMSPLNGSAQDFDSNSASPSFHLRETRDFEGPHRSQEDFPPSTCCSPHCQHSNNHASFHIRLDCKHGKEMQVDQRPQIASIFSLSSSLTSSRLSTSTTPATTSKMHNNILPCSSCKPRLFILLLLLSSHLSQALSTQGVFEVQLISLENSFGRLENGSCCSGSPGADGLCPRRCDVFFFICLSHFRANIPEVPECTFGNKTSAVYSPNHNLNSTTYKLPFDFVWPGDFVLVIEAIQSSTRESSQATPAERERGRSEQRLVLKSTVRRELNSSAKWTKEDSSNNFSTLTFRYRVICSENQFGPRCTITCIPRDDQLGHYQCNEDGSKACLPGWSGEDNYCVNPFCECKNGDCVGPNECKCREGWEGERCDKCLTYPGCQHGSCKNAFQCNCHPGWDGPYCNEDLNFCSKHQPCENGGTCHVVSGGYTCSCGDGFSGNNCEVETRDCKKNHQSCLNGGVCRFTNGENKCSCSEGYEGRRCELKKDWTCADQPCSNNSTCVSENSINDVRRYTCLCTTGHTGVNCEENINECNSNPCLNGGKCINQLASFSCLCPAHFTGKRCERKSDCANKHCLNGGLCKERQNGGGSKCDCKPGFSGDLCQHEINHCLLNPCKNGATCKDHIHTFQCRCAPGFVGKYCDTKTDFCAGQPCLNGGTCSSIDDSYFCHCPQGYQGMSCEIFTATHSAEGQHNATETNDAETGPGALQFVVALVLGILLPLVVVGIIVAAIWWMRRQRYMKKDREREKNELAVISLEQVENDINKSMHLNNRKIFDKSSQKMTPEEVNHFLKYKEDEGSQSYDHPDLKLNFQRNQLHLNKHRTRHKPPSANDSYAYQSKVPTKYKEINQDSWPIQKTSRHTEV